MGGAHAYKSGLHATKEGSNGVSRSLGEEGSPNKKRRKKGVLAGTGKDAAEHSDEEPPILKLKDVEQAENVMRAGPKESPKVTAPVEKSMLAEEPAPAEKSAPPEKSGGSEKSGAVEMSGAAENGKKLVSTRKVKKVLDKFRKRGVVYLSRIPPHMKPQKVRQLLSQYGEVLRVYLAPEDSEVRLRRKRAGGSRGKNFTEGWVEFAKKRVAKVVAQMLNGNAIGGQRRSAYFDDLWNIKYLKKFKWDDLTGEVAYRNAVREQRLAAEISAAKRDRDFYLARVDQGKALAAMEERKRKKAQASQQGTPPSLADHHRPLDAVQPHPVAETGAGDGRHFAASRSGSSPAAVLADGDGLGGSGPGHSGRLRVVRRVPQRAVVEVEGGRPRLAASVLAKVWGERDGYQDGAPEVKKKRKRKG